MTPAKVLQSFNGKSLVKGEVSECFLSGHDMERYK